MLPYRDSRFTYIALGIFFLIVIGYAYFEAQGILFGPVISVAPYQTSVREPFVLIKGTTRRIESLSMNGKSVPVTENGAFEEPYLLAPGYNRIVLDAEDKYGRKRSVIIEVVFSSPAVTAPSQQPATTTESTSTSPVAPLE